MLNFCPSINQAIDHLIVFVSDLTSARAAFEALGFLVSDRGTHETFKTSNHLIMLERDYIELLAVDEPTVGNARQRAQIAAGGGVRGLALPTRDIGFDYARAVDQGLCLSSPQAFGREVLIENRSQTARFRTSFLNVEDGDPMIFYCEHNTPEYVWRAGTSDHPNGASVVRSITIPATSPDRIVDSIATMLDIHNESASEQTLYKGGQAIAVSASAPSVIEICVDHMADRDRLAGAGFSSSWRTDGAMITAHPALGMTNIVLIAS